MMKRLIMLGFFALVLSFGFISVQPSFALAQTQNSVQDQLLGQVDRTGTQVYGQGAQNQGNLLVLAGQLIRIVLSFIGVILLGLFLYAGFLWMTAGGNEDRVKDAKQILQNAIIGLVLTLSAFAISSFVLQALNSAGLGDNGASNAANQQTTN